VLCARVIRENRIKESEERDKIAQQAEEKREKQKR
jgi:hypothetical protein